jgi:tetratricopeptide (TPR) repeat protein
MKQLRLVVAVFAAGFLSACSSQVPTVSQPSVAIGSLETAEAYLMRGDDFSEIQEYDRAILDYDQAIRLKPDYAEAHNNRGYAYYWKGDATHAIADYSQAIELRPNRVSSFPSPGLFLSSWA